uniref:Uncharacterized protein n=1 Tax=Parascaris univalens TaxID=6257 RepID=A0A915A1E6_PARUN
MHRTQSPKRKRSPSYRLILPKISAPQFSLLWKFWLIATPLFSQKTFESAAVHSTELLAGQKTGFLFTFSDWFLQGAIYPVSLDMAKEVADLPPSHNSFYMSTSKDRFLQPVYST